jgi:hypothetical protein
MKILITGHTSGIGKALYDYCICNVAKELECVHLDSKRFKEFKQYNYKPEGATRSNDKPIVDIQKWFNPEVDVFINNAFDDENPYAQAKAVEYVYNIWKGNKAKTIISIGSTSADYDKHLYAKGKQLLDQTHQKYWENSRNFGPKMSIIRLGWTDTPRAEKFHLAYLQGTKLGKLSIKSICNILFFVLTFNGQIKDITVEPNYEN